LIATYQASRLTKNSRKCVNKLYYRTETLDELPIVVPIVFERFQIFLKQGQDGAGGVTVLDLIGERIFVQTYACLFGIFIDGIENGLKV
jgi:hypothetical protein